MNESSPYNKILSLARMDSPDFSKKPPGEEVFFLLVPDTEDRFFLRFCNTQGADIRPADLPENKLNRLIKDISRKQRIQFRWEGEVEGLYLDEQPSLFQDIREADTPLFYRNPETPLEDRRCSGHILLELKKEGEDYMVQTLLRSEERLIAPVHPLNPDIVLADGGIYDCQHLGNRYSHLRDMEGRINREELESYLSLFCSVFPMIEIHLEGYSWLEEKKGQAERGLSFESLLEDGTLKMTAQWCYDGLPMEFISTYRPQLAVRVDHKNNNLQPVMLHYPPEEADLKSLIKDLKKLARTEGIEENFVLEEEALYLSAELAAPFLTQNLGGLVSKYRLFGTESLKHLKLKHSSPRFQFTLGAGIDYFEGKGTLLLEEESFPLDKALKLYEDHNYIPLSDGSRAIVDPAYIKTLKRLVGRFDKKNGVYKVSLFDLPLMEELIQARIKGEGVVRSRELFEGFNSIDQTALPAGELKGTLRDYQVYGVKWLAYLQKHGLGGCLADDMGLGKTIQTIALLAAYYAPSKKQGTAKPSLIVMPRSLLYNWEKELARFAPQLEVCRYYGAQRDLEAAGKQQIILTTYALVRNDIEKLKEESYAYVILDEAQAIKNRESRIARAVVLLQGEHRLGLSGTPIENNLGELYSLFRFLNPAMFGTSARFNREFIAPIHKDSDDAAVRLLSKKISPFILRRLKQQVAQELPERSEQLIYVDMEGEQLKLYEERRRFYERVIKEKVALEGVEKSSFLILQGLLELRQLASVPETKTEGAVESAKWQALLEHLEELISEGHRALIFTNFLGTIEILQEKLARRGIEHLTMTGSTRNRSSLVEEFQSSNRIKVFLMTLKTGGVGLNLTGADYVYILDPWWNRSAEQQAIDRTHRIGQTRNVFCYRLISRGSIEEKMLELQERKKALFSSIISTDSQTMKKLSREDISYLLQREL